jgi:hypothetical protein
MMVRCLIFKADQISYYVINKGMAVEGKTLRDAISPSGGPQVQLQQLHKQFRMIPLATQAPGNKARSTSFEAPQLIDLSISLIFLCSTAYSFD